MKKTPKLFFNYHAKLTSVITMGALVHFLALLIFLYDVISVMPSTLKTSMKF